VFPKDHKKELWRLSVENQLKQMDRELKVGRLTASKKRHPVYKNQLPAHDSRDTMHEMNTLSNNDAFKPRDSFRSVRPSAVVEESPDFPLSRQSSMTPDFRLSRQSSITPGRLAPVSNKVSSAINNMIGAKMQKEEEEGEGKQDV
jgi:hypothetical protein